MVADDCGAVQPARENKGEKKENYIWLLKTLNAIF